MPPPAFFSQGYFGYLESFVVLNEFWDRISVKNAFGILVGIGLNLRSALG